VWSIYSSQTKKTKYFRFITKITQRLDVIRQLTGFWIILAYVAYSAIS